MVYRCVGCGVNLQDKDPNKPGYIQLLSLNKSVLYCQRCYRIKNYNEMSKNELPFDVYLQIISKITYTNSLFIYVIDSLEMINSINLDVLEKLRKKDVIFVINKRDLLPRSIKDGTLKKHVKDYLKHFNIKYKDMIVVSSKAKYNVDLLIEKMMKWSKGRDVYFIGLSNVGKSTLLNAIIRAVGVLDYDVLTTSKILGTTLSLVKIPLFEGKNAIYDTPGLVLKDSLLSNLDFQDYKTFLSSKEIKPLVYQMEENNSLIIGGVMMVSFKNDANVILYNAPSVEVLRCKTEKGLSYFPYRLNELFDLKTVFHEFDEYEFEVKAGQDLNIFGLGFISFKNNCHIKIHIIKGVKVVLTNGLFN